MKFKLNDKVIIKLDEKVLWTFDCQNKVGTIVATPENRSETTYTVDFNGTRVGSYEFRIVLYEKKETKKKMPSKETQKNLKALVHQIFTKKADDLLSNSTWEEIASFVVDKYSRLELFELFYEKKKK